MLVIFDCDGVLVDSERLSNAALREALGELGGEADVIATGGLASHIVPHTDSIDEIDDLLTLTGLRLIHERNASD